MEYKSKYKGAEIDAAIGKVSTLETAVSGQGTKLEEQDAKLTELEEEVKQTIIPSITDGKYVAPNGYVDSAADACLTDFVDVSEAAYVGITGEYLYSNRSIVGYDSDKAYVREMTEFVSGQPLKIPNGISFLRITGYKGKPPIVTITLQSKIEKKINGVKGEIGLEWMAETSASAGENLVVECPVDIQRGERFSVTILGGIDDFNVAFGDDEVLVCRNAVLSANKDISSITLTSVSPAASSASVKVIIRNGLQAMVESLYEGSPLMEREQFVSGYLGSDGISINAGESYRTSPFIPIQGGSLLAIDHIYDSWSGAVFYYGQDKTLLSVEAATKPGYNISRKITQAPKEAYFIRYVIQAGWIDGTAVTYLNVPFKYDKECRQVASWNSQTHDSISRLFTKISDIPVITIIDDDTQTEAEVTRFYNACETNGIKGCYAVLTEQMEKIPALAELLLEYDRKGFNSVIHAYTQHTAFEKATRNMEVATEQLVKGMQDMQQAGFTDFRHWVTPYGVNDADMRQLASKVGLDCLVSIGQEKVVGTSPDDSRYNIPRISWKPDYDHEAVKALIDECVEKRGWLVIGCHIYQWTDEQIAGTFAEIITYAKNAGATFMTLGEALRKRMPVYQFYETM